MTDWVYASPSHDPDVPTTNLVFVRSRDGNTGARNPTLLGGGNTDTHLIYEGLSRVAADAVLSGAETIRGGHFIFSTWLPELVALRGSKGLPRHPTIWPATSANCGDWESRGSRASAAGRSRVNYSTRD